MGIFTALLKTFFWGGVGGGGSVSVFEEAACDATKLRFVHAVMNYFTKILT
jgi:hypothetical protein